MGRTIDLWRCGGIAGTLRFRWVTVVSHHKRGENTVTPRVAAALSLPTCKQTANRQPRTARAERHPLALPGVQRFDLLRVLLVDRLALELHGRRQLVAAGLPVGREDLELLDLLDACEVLVGAVDALLHGGDHLVVRREALEGRVVDPVLLREAGRHVGVERDQRDVERALVADADRLPDQWR